jgi:bacillopeptidase F
MMMPAPSRRAVLEQSKLLKQVWLLAGLLLCVFVLCFAIIIPLVLRIGAKPDLMPTQVAKPLRTPVLNAPLTATSSATIALTGFAEPNVQIIVLNSGTQAGEGSTDESGNFSVELTLMTGENELNVKAMRDGAESNISQSYTIEFDDEPPSLEINASEKQTVEGKKNQLFGISGKSDVGARVTLNDRFLTVKSDGSFSTTYQLGNGDNTLTIRAVDRAGNKTEKVVIVTYHE